MQEIEFKGYRLMPASQFHADLATSWTHADPRHAGTVDPRFWLDQGRGVESYLVFDPTGPVFFFKMEPFQCFEADDISTGVLYALRGGWPLGAGTRVVQIHVQVMPITSDDDSERTRTALMVGTPWFEELMARAGVKEIFFDVQDAKLLAFCIKRLGFINYPLQRFRLRKRLCPVRELAAS